mmetsp:Transcript_11568/g.35199  ORF Transcript_11568/g.35199 Transcript_11568/m.35199 type:complete len:403 (-) Transcript_11568:283-1491(-)
MEMFCDWTFPEPRCVVLNLLICAAWYCNRVFTTSMGFVISALATAAPAAATTRSSSSMAGRSPAAPRATDAMASKSLSLTLSLSLSLSLSKFGHEGLQNLIAGEHYCAGWRGPGSSGRGAVEKPRRPLLRGDPLHHCRHLPHSSVPAEEDPLASALGRPFGLVLHDVRLNPRLHHVQRGGDGGRDSAPNRSRQEVDVSELRDASLAATLRLPKPPPRRLGHHPVDSREGDVPEQRGYRSLPQLWQRLAAEQRRGGRARPLGGEGLRPRPVPLERRGDQDGEASGGAPRDQCGQGALPSLTVLQPELQGLVGRHVDAHLRYRHGECGRGPAPKHAHPLRPHDLAGRVERSAEDATRCRGSSYMANTCACLRDHATARQVAELTRARPQPREGNPVRPKVLLLR